MKKRFTEEQIAFALRQAESGTAVAEIIRKLGVSDDSFLDCTSCHTLSFVVDPSW